jgi:hypothetical protein
MQETPIPEFLDDYLFMRGDMVDEITSIYYIFYTRDKADVPGLMKDRKKKFVRLYRLIKKHLDFRLRIPYATLYNDSYGILANQFFIENEANLLDLTDSPQFLDSFNLILDIPMYWFDEQTNQLGKSIMPGGIELKYNGKANNWTITTILRFMLFTNHLRCRKMNSPNEDKHLYFEPAAKLNRDIFRNFARAVEESFPELAVEFSTECGSIPYADNYGYPDNAESSHYEEGE